MGNHLESITSRVWDAGVFRLVGRAIGLIHEKPRGSGDAAILEPHAGHGVSRDNLE